MSCIVKSRNPNGVTYVYRSTSVWDPVKKMSIPKRQCIGKIDPQSGEVVPTGKRGRRRKDTEQAGELAATERPAIEMDGINDEVGRSNETIADQRRRYQDTLMQVRDDLTQMQALKVELKRSEATLDALIKAIQPLL